MKIATLHRWPRDPRAAIALQRRLAARVRLEPIPCGVRIVAGADVAFSRDGADVIAGVVVCELSEDVRFGARTLHQTAGAGPGRHTSCGTGFQPVISAGTGPGRYIGVVERRTARVACRFPYVPGLLSFRELPGVLAAFRKLTVVPEAVLCDGQGLAHPRRFGLACHLGLWLGLPTVGCAKSRLCGTFDEPERSRGGWTPLLLDDEQVGVVLRTRDGVKPLFVSPGHLCDQASAVRLTLAATTRYRLPEPTRLAHQLVSAARSA